MAMTTNTKKTKKCPKILQQHLWLLLAVVLTSGVFPINFKDMIVAYNLIFAHTLKKIKKHVKPVISIKGWNGQ